MQPCRNNEWVRRLGGVRFQQAIIAKGFPGGAEQGQQRDGQCVQQPQPVAPRGGTDTDRAHAHAEADILCVAEPALDIPYKTPLIT